MKKFPKRKYKSFKEFFTDFREIMKNQKRFKTFRENNVITLEFQERLMLAVTMVNGCRYCTYYHTKVALKSEISKEELQQLLNGVTDNCPIEEAVALIYAQHWAETDGHPDVEAREKLVNTYGSEKAEAIELVLRMIRFGNLSGNSFDYFLYRISFGRWGV